jgi:hypothetical protein
VQDQSSWNTDRKLVIAKLEDISCDVKAICHDIDGNGKPGLKERVGDIEKAAKVVKWVLGIIIAAMLATWASGLVREAPVVQQHIGKP